MRSLAMGSPMAAMTGRPSLARVETRAGARGGRGGRAVPRRVPRGPAPGRRRWAPASTPPERAGGRAARRSSSPRRAATTRCSPASRTARDPAMARRHLRPPGRRGAPRDAHRSPATRRFGSASAPTGSSSTSRSPATWRSSGARARLPRVPCRDSRAMRREPPSSPTSSAGPARAAPAGPARCSPTARAAADAA